MPARTPSAAPVTRPSYAGSRPKAVSTVLGRVQVDRAWYHCPGCERGFAPRDEQVGVAGTSLSPGLAEMIARAGAEVPFGKAAALLEDLAGAALLRARAIVSLPPPEPVPDMLYAEVDGTGVPVRASETGGRPGKDGGKQAGTREIKLRPGARGWVQFLVTIRRCQRSSVPGVTIRCTRKPLGSTRDSAASTARSVQSGRGPGFARRRTSTSASFDAEERASSASQDSTATANR